MKYILILGLIILGTSLSNGQTISKSYYKGKRSKIKKKTQIDILEKTRPFDMGYFYDSTNRHYILRFSIRNDSLIPVDAQIAIGNLPFHPNTGGLQLIYFDGNNQELGSYFIEDPQIGRSCDDSKIGVVELEEIQEAFIQLPFDTRISEIELMDTGVFPKQSNRYDIEQILKEAN